MHLHGVERRQRSSVILPCVPQLAEVHTHIGPVFEQHRNLLWQRASLLVLV